MGQARLRWGFGLLVLASGGAQLACAHVTNYLDPSAPRYLTRDGTPPDLPPSSLRVVTFNVEKGRRVSEAIAALSTQAELRAPDVLLLQEMDAPGVARVARALGMNSVYYPASRQPRGGPDWGNAILSPWPIVDSGKVLLPHWSYGTARGRIATRATLSLPGGPLRVYSVHLGSPLGMGSGKRRDQALAVLADAEGATEPVVIAGDFNSHGVGRVFEARGFCWPTQDVGRTVMRFSFDHVLARGLCGPGMAWRAGVVREVKDASDHRPVWAVGPPPG